MLWPPGPGEPYLDLEGNEDGGWPDGGAGEEQLPAGSEGEEEWVGGSDDEAADEAEEDEEAEESAAMASLRRLHHLAALRGLILDGCSLSSLAWLQVCAACSSPAFLENGCIVSWGTGFSATIPHDPPCTLPALALQGCSRLTRFELIDCKPHDTSHLSDLQHFTGVRLLHVQHNEPQSSRSKLCHCWLCRCWLYRCCFLPLLALLMLPLPLLAVPLMFPPLLDLPARHTNHHSVGACCWAAACSLPTCT
jgi:hypothetical protein